MLLAFIDFFLLFQSYSINLESKHVISFSNKLAGKRLKVEKKSVFALSHVFFYDKACLINETLEHMKEKRNHLHSFAHFSGLFHNFPGSFEIFWHLSLRKIKNILFNSKNIVEDGLGQKNRHWAGLFFPRASFNYILTLTKNTFWKLRLRKSCWVMEQAALEYHRTLNNFFLGRYFTTTQPESTTDCKPLVHMMLQSISNLSRCMHGKISQINKWIRFEISRAVSENEYSSLALRFNNDMSILVKRIQHEINILEAKIPVLSINLWARYHSPPNGEEKVQEQRNSAL